MDSSTRWWWCIPMFMAAGCVSDANNDGAQHALESEVCGFEVLPSPQTIFEDACESGRTVYGPARFEREQGKPVAETAVFEVASSGDACVTIRNGDGGGRISSGRVTVDGASAAVPSDFNQQSDGVERSFALGEGTHELSVDLASGPGSFIEVEVREPFPQLNDAAETIGPNGALRLTNVATDHPLLTPNGDGHHDDTVFNLDGEPLIELPGKEEGTTDYFLDWKILVVSLDTCATEETGISGQTKINSPTNVRTTWDGTLDDGTLVDSGSYAYYAEVSLIREDGFVYDTVVSPRYGMIVDSAPADYDEGAKNLGQCDPLNDPFVCRCPGAGGIPTGDTNCNYADPHPGHGNLARIDDPLSIDRSFIATTQGPDGRWNVAADMRAFNHGGFVVQTQGVWDSEAELRQWVSEMTGVPTSAGDSLFNFDYTQVGTSTAITIVGLADHSFNHFLLDAITDQYGSITIDGGTTDVAALFNDDALAPSQYALDNARTGDECTANGTVIGDDPFRAKFCAYNTAVSLSSGTDLGVYALRTTVFDVGFGGAFSTVEEYCATNAIFACAIRNFTVPAESITIESSYYVDTADGSQFAFTEQVQAFDTVGLSFTHDRGDGADGVCTRAVTERAGALVRMDSADGSVPETCATNGIFF